MGQEKKEVKKLGLTIEDLDKQIKSSEEIKDKLERQYFMTLGQLQSLIQQKEFLQEKIKKSKEKNVKTDV